MRLPAQAQLLEFEATLNRQSMQICACRLAKGVPMPAMRIPAKWNIDGAPQALAATLSPPEALPKTGHC
jgi:hypothetical protein